MEKVSEGGEIGLAGKGCAGLAGVHESNKNFILKERDVRNTKHFKISLPSLGALPMKVGDVKSQNESKGEGYRHCCIEGV